MPYNIMLAWFPGNNSEHPDVMQYYLSLLEPMLNDKRIDKIKPWYLASHPIDRVRNQCVKDAIANKADYILMVDNDMSPDCMPGATQFWPTAWEFMMERRKNEEKDPGSTEFLPCAVGAPYCGAPPNELPMVFKWTQSMNDHPDPCFQIKMYDRDEAAAQTGVKEVAAIGPGLILFDTRLFQLLPQPWFDFEYKDEPMRANWACSEDVFCCRNASLMGLKIYCAWDCWAGHWKLKLVIKPIPLVIGSVRKTYAEAIAKYQAKLKEETDAVRSS